MAREYECTLVVHGGCGVIDREKMTKEFEMASRESLRSALAKGFKILESGGTASEAVVAAIVVLEDDDKFNAGKGAVFSRTGNVECDAGIMDSVGNFGGVSCCRTIKNPILAALEVDKATSHALLCGVAADNFAAQRGLVPVSADYFFTQRRWDMLQSWLKAKAEDDANALNKGFFAPILDHDGQVSKPPADPVIGPQGTVGAVALDSSGQLASGSSSAGMTGRMDGRVSDSSICGAGFYADDTVAVSGSGTGDYFIKTAACHEAAVLVKYSKLSLEAAANNVVFETLGECHAGLIAVDIEGNITMPYNTEGFYRGYAKKDKIDVKIWEY